MAAFEISNFLGRLPVVSPTELPQNNAQVATNVRMQGRELQPAPSIVAAGSVTGTAVKTIFRYTDSVWLEWNEDVNVARSSIPNDTWDRVLWTAETGVPQISSNDVISSGAAPHPDVSYDLGVPPPDGTPSVAITGTPTNPDDLPDTRFYVVTMVDKYGAEGAPSAASNEVEWRVGETATVTLPGAPSGNRVFTAKNIYRTNTGTGGTEFQFVAQVTPATTNWVDNVASDYLGEVLTTEDFDLPDSNMRGLVTLPNGYHAGFFGNTLCFSEPGFPHAWPVKYRQAIKAATIVGLGVYGDTVVVMTDAKPYLAVGTHPQSTALLEMEVAQGCLSKRGIVNTGYGVLYPGPDGAILVDQNGARNVTQGLFTRAQWQALTPSSFLGAVAEGLVMYTATGGVFLFNPQAPELGIVDWGAAFPQAVYYDEDEDTLYGVQTASSTLYKMWDDATSGSGADVWRSKVIETFGMMTPGVIRVLATGYPVDVRLYKDGALHLGAQITGNDPIRFNANDSLGDRWEVEIFNIPAGAGVYRVQVAETMDDLF
jgi:hypothetical protein